MPRAARRRRRRGRSRQAGPAGRPRTPCRRPRPQPPHRARRPSRARERGARERVAVVLEKDKGLHRSRFSTRNSTIAAAARPAVLDPAAVSASRAAARRRARRSPARHTSDVGRRQCLLRLGLRAHDPLQRRIPRLVDRIRDRDDGRQRRPDPLVAVLGLAAARDGAALDRELGDLGDHRLPASSATAAQRQAPSPSADCCPNRTRSALSRPSTPASA